MINLKYENALFSFRLSASTKGKASWMQEILHTTCRSEVSRFDSASSGSLTITQHAQDAAGSTERLRQPDKLHSADT